MPMLWQNSKAGNRFPNHSVKAMLGHNGLKLQWFIFDSPYVSSQISQDSAPVALFEVAGKRESIPMFHNC